MKKRGEAADIFEKNNRPELAANERSEALIMQRYLPAQLDDGEVAAIVDQAVAQVQSQSDAPLTIRDMGKVMGVATAAAAGGADGKRLSAAVKAKLS